MPTLFFGEETMKITKRTDFPDSKEFFYVLKSNPDIRHGSYKITYKVSRIKVTGYYNNGIKDGFWVEYRKGGKKKCEGLYRGEDKIGVWNYYGGSIN
jgi:antitoxin component YwqK of YwqJK toxin-antitoxin module